MGSSATRKLEGFVSIGGELPFLNPNDIRIVGLDVPQTNDNWFAFCPRADEDLEPEWIEDIRNNGVRQPVDVFRDGDTVVMLEGRRRVRAARLVWAEQVKKGVPPNERITVRVNVRRGTPTDLFAYNIGSENRKARTPPPRGALMAQAEKNGMDNAAIAQMFGVTSQTVRNMLKLLDLSADVQKAVEANELPVREAIKLADKPREEQKQILEELRANDATKGARAANGIHAAKNGKKVTNDTRKMRSRGFLEKWREVVKKDERLCAVKVELNEVLKFILGGGVPSDFPERVKESLVEAGLKK